MPADASYENVFEGLKLLLNMGFEIWEVYGSCTGRISD